MCSPALDTGQRLLASNHIVFALSTSDGKNT